MMKKKFGLVIFWTSIIWMIAWVVIGNTRFMPLMRSLTTEEINQTVWAFIGPLSRLYGVAFPLGAITAGIGILLYAGAKGSTIWKIGIGLFLAFMISMVALIFNLYSPPLFGIGGSLILLSFIGILWFWAKERMALEGSSSTASDFKLVSHIFMLIAAWFLCGKAADGFVKGLEGLPTMSMMNILVLLTLGWVFQFLGFFNSRNKRG
ncbi:hypothetical protein ACFLXB_06920 [Chloroflexota bacterium]